MQNDTIDLTGEEIFMKKVDSIAKASGVGQDPTKVTSVFNRSNSVQEINNLSDEEEDNRVKEAVRSEIEHTLAIGIPVSEYDVERQKIYLLYSDGHRVYL